MLQVLPTALVKASDTSEKLLNEIHQIMYYLYRTKEITKKVDNIQERYNTKWLLYLWILKIVQNLIFIDYYLIFRIH